ncbi:hypothetical protein [Micromonospora halophytica]|uniref:Uncharacterized protein n=1 Tax=Micromonospora halophytica TaxID=47864 RepID=A0A1C5J3A1_9ACTN|nr:hypothetical protein [Micromonospora halophytica]SCG64741.1 hypothetical protein GA0070560_12068 [Micromonospora halophytica]
MVVRREVLRGQVWFDCPTICVEDSADLLALHLPPDAEFGFPDHGAFPCGRHGSAPAIVRPPCGPDRLAAAPPAGDAG